MSLLLKQQRTARLCCHCLRNIAYYRAWWDAGQPDIDNDFVVNGNGNFIDIAVLEWCKLFTSPRKEKHHYQHSFENKADADIFLAAMLTNIGKTQQEWDGYIGAMKKYRDKYVAHWDDDPDGALRPVFNTAIASATYLLEFLNANGEDGWWPFPSDAAQFYQERKAFAQTCL